MSWFLQWLIENYFDLGASFLIHNEKYLAGLSFKRLNKPNISYDGEDDEKNTLPMQISLQGGYEFDLNPYERRFLQDIHTFILLFPILSKGNHQ